MKIISAQEKKRKKKERKKETKQEMKFSGIELNRELMRYFRWSRGCESERKGELEAGHGEREEGEQLAMPRQMIVPGRVLNWKQFTVISCRYSRRTKGLGLLINMRDTYD